MPTRSDSERPVISQSERLTRRKLPGPLAVDSDDGHADRGLLERRLEQLLGLVRPALEGIPGIENPRGRVRHLPLRRIVRRALPARPRGCGAGVRGRPAVVVT